MSVVSVKLKSTRFSANEAPTLKGTRVYRVVCDNKAEDTADTAAEGVGLTIGAAWSDRYPGVLAKSIEADDGEVTGDGRIQYLVTVEYSNESDNQNGGSSDSQHPDPTEWPAVLRLSYDVSEETFRQAKGEPTAEVSSGASTPTAWCWGKSICNSAGTPYKDGLREPVCDQVYTYEKNIPTSDFFSLCDLLDKYVNTVNSKDFELTYRDSKKRFKKGTVLLWAPTSEPGYRNGVQYETVQFQLRVRKDGWKRKVLDEGYCAFPAATTPSAELLPGPIVSNGEPITEPAHLDGRGHKLSADDTAVFLNFPMKDEKDFRKLPF